MASKGKKSGKRSKGESGQKRVTSYDVAKAAGVSQSAVSRTFSKGGYASEETRKRVLAAAQKLGFAPNAIARSLITQRSQIIAIIVADLQYSFYVTLLHRLCDVVREAGYQVQLISTPDSEDIEKFIPDIIAYRADGAIIASTRLSSNAADLCKEAGIPVVLVNRYVEDANFSSVAADNVHAGRIAAEFLISAGHRRLAFVAGLADTSTSRDREQGFFQRAAELGAPKPLRREGNFTYEGGHQAALELMALKRAPDAFFCASDIMAMGAMDALRYELGLRVGEDVSVIGFNNADMAAWQSYQLTSITSDAEAMSKRAIEILEAEITGGDVTPHREFMKGYLVVRQSARIPESKELFDLDLARIPPQITAM